MNALDLLIKTEDGKFKPKIGERGFIGLFAGPHGSGKSGAAVSWVEQGPVYMFDMDNRVRGALAAIAWLGAEKMKNLDFDFYNPYDGFKAINDKCDLFLNQANARTLKYKTILFEGTSSLQTLLQFDARNLRGQKSPGKGQMLGALRFLDPSDYNYTAVAIKQIYLNFCQPMAELGYNVIFTGHVVDRWGKPGTPTDEEGKPIGVSNDDQFKYASNIVIGEKLLGTERVSEEIPGYFDEVYRFQKTELGSKVFYKAKFTGDFAKTSLPLSGKELDYTGKSFYSHWKSLVDEVTY